MSDAELGALALRLRPGSGGEWLALCDGVLELVQRQRGECAACAERRRADVERVLRWRARHKGRAKIE